MLIIVDVSTGSRSIGETILPLAEIKADGMMLITLPKGIYKPQDLKYALSIRIVGDSDYADGGVVQRPEGGWTLRYHQENSNPDDRDKAYTNRGLMACIEDEVPVGVLREVGRNGRQRLYEVLGLAQPVSWGRTVTSTSNPRRKRCLTTPDDLSRAHRPSSMSRATPTYPRMTRMPATASLGK